MVRMTAVLVMAVSLGAQETRYSSAWDLVKGEHDKDGDGQVSATGPLAPPSIWPSP